MTSLKWGGGGGGCSSLTYRLTALGLDYSFGDECMFLKKDHDKQRLYFKVLYGICMMITVYSQL